MVDGEDNVPSNIWTQKFYDVQKYLTVSHHGRLTYSLITNKKFWDSACRPTCGRVSIAL